MSPVASCLTDLVSVLLTQLFHFSYRSGGGKSTTVAMIERFYDPASGSLEYMGNDLRSLNVHWYRDQIGYVGQEPTLFNETISKNIAYGAPNATQAEIEEAAKQANAHLFIESFANGYQTSGKLKSQSCCSSSLSMAFKYIHPFIFCLHRAKSGNEEGNSPEVSTRQTPLLENSPILPLPKRSRRGLLNTALLCRSKTKGGHCPSSGQETKGKLQKRKCGG